MQMIRKDKPKARSLSPQDQRAYKYQDPHLMKRKEPSLRRKQDES